MMTNPLYQIEIKKANGHSVTLVNVKTALTIEELKEKYSNFDNSGDVVEVVVTESPLAGGSLNVIGRSQGT